MRVILLSGTLGVRTFCSSRISSERLSSSHSASWSCCRGTPQASTLCNSSCQSFSTPPASRRVSHPSAWRELHNRGEKVQRQIRHNTDAQGTCPADHWMYASVI